MGRLCERTVQSTCDHAMSFSHRRSILESLSRIGGVARVIITVGLLASIGVASTSTIPQKLTVHRSMRAVPRRFVIHPNGATLPVNRAQRFDVTDSEGRPVAVRWNVSGLGCSGASCGTIDDKGDIPHAVFASSPAGRYFGGRSSFRSQIFGIDRDSARDHYCHECKCWFRAVFHRRTANHWWTLSFKDRTCPAGPNHYCDRRRSKPLQSSKI